MDRMKYFHVPGVSIAVINDGDVEWARGYGVLEMNGNKTVSPDTLFQAASISKPVSAMMALRLVEQGKLDLDRDVNKFFSSWQLPENEYTEKNKVTLRGYSFTYRRVNSSRLSRIWLWGVEVPSLLQNTEWRSHQQIQHRYE